MISLDALPQLWLDGPCREQPAIVTSSGSISYRQLACGAARFGVGLQEKAGLRGKPRVALLLDSTVDSLVALWGALLAPVDCSIGLINADVAASRREQLFRLFEPDVVATSADLLDGFSGSFEAPTGAIPDKLLVLFTSGSEGEPKGVRHSLRTLLPAIRNQTAAMGMVGGQKQLLSTSPAHVIGLLGVLRAHLLEATLCLGAGPDIAGTVEFVRSEAIDHVHTVPTWLRAFLREWNRAGGGRLPFRSVLLSGETVRQSDYTQAAAFLAPECRFIAGLGATEVPTFCFEDWSGGEGDGDAPIPVGRAAAGRTIRLVDTGGETVAGGETGTVIVSGEDLWLGYLGQGDDDRTEFRSGDLGRIDEHGSLHLLGRADRLVKVSGYRVNPADLEAALGAHPDIEDVCCVPNRSGASPRLLAGYTTAPGRPRPRVDELREFLAARVEPHLLPEALIRLDVLPRTAGGKPDLQRVEALLVAAIAEENGAEPDSEIWRAVRTIWVTLLPSASGLPGESFYQLGGDSLLATQMCFAIETALQFRPPLTLLLQYPRLRDLVVFLERHAERVSTDLAPTSTSTPGELVNLTPGQRAIWIDHQRVNGDPLYHLVADYEIDGALDTGALQRALDTVVERHQAFRLWFGVDNARPFQMAADTARLPLQRFDPAETDGSTEGIRGLLEKFGRQPFDLERPPLARAALLSTAPDHHYFVLVFHHLIIDGHAFATLYRDLERAYDNASAAGMPGFDYLGYARRAGWRASNMRERALAFWSEHLLSAPGEGQDEGTGWASGGADGDYRGEDVWFRLPSNLTRRLDTVARGLETTRFVVLLASWQTIWMRLTGQTSATAGVPFSGRIDEDLQDPIGFFVNTLPIRARLTREMRFDTLVARLKETVTTILDLQGYPGSNLKTDLGADAPLFRQLFALQPDRRGLSLKGTQCRRFGVGTGTAKVDLAFLIFPDGNELEVLVEYRVAAFSPTKANTLFHSWQVLLERALEAPATALGELPLLTASMHARLNQWSGGARARPGFEETLPDLVERWARQSPDRVAVRDSVGRTFTYGEMWVASSYVARALQMRGIRRGHRVGCTVARSADLPALLLGILRTGAAYVTLGVDESSSTARASLDLLLSDATDSLRPCAGAPEPVTLSPGDTACLFFTSGTTGAPKGALIPHRAIVRLVREPEFARFDTQTIQLQLAPLNFDASTLEIWGPVANGGIVVFAPEGPLSLSEMGRLIEAERSNTLWLTAGLFHLFADVEEPWLAGVQTLLAGGDVVSPAKARKVLERFPHLRLINGYGPTENTTFSCCHPISLAGLEGPSIPLGTPIRGTEVHVLGSGGDLLPPGCIGEICLGGDGLFAGYLANEAGWAVGHPDGSGVLYRTGDYGFWNEQGALMFCGRRDRQVKIRGFRIELDAIERQLATLPGVSQLVIDVDRADDLHPAIVAFYVAEPGKTAVETTLLQAAREMLPAHQVPTRWVCHSTLPLTAQGKVDRPALLRNSRERTTAATARRGFENGIERSIAVIWENLLGRAPIAAQTDFFDAGGDSILAMRAAQDMETSFSVPIPLRLLFQARTPRALAACISRQDTAPDFRHLVPLRAANESDGIPLFFAHGAGGSLFHLLPLIRQLPAHIPVYGLQGDLETARNRPFDEIAADYVKEIRRFRPQGPWFIAGYSRGGVIAHEIARRLTEESGGAVRLFLIDTYPQNLPALWRVPMQIGFAAARGRRALSRHPEDLGGLARRGYRWLTRNSNTRIRTQPRVRAPKPFDEAMARLAPRPYSGDATLFLATDSGAPLRLGWRYLMRRPIDVCRLQGNHGSIFREDLSALTAALAERYDRYARNAAATASRG